MGLGYMAFGQNLLGTFLGPTHCNMVVFSKRLFWCSRGYRGFDPYKQAWEPIIAKGASRKTLNFGSNPYDLQLSSARSIRRVFFFVKPKQDDPKGICYSML